MDQTPRVVIVGGGFGGLEAATALRDALPRRTSIASSIVRIGSKPVEEAPKPDGPGGEALIDDGERISAAHVLFAPPARDTSE